MKAGQILQEKEYTASANDRKKIHSVYKQLAYWLNSFKVFGEPQYKLMRHFFMDKIDNLYIEDHTIKTYLKNAVIAKLLNRKHLENEL